MDQQLRDRVARAIHAQCRATPWPEGDLPLDAAERRHCYACADVAIAAMDAIDDDWPTGPCDCDGCRPVGTRSWEVEPPIVTVRPVGELL